MPYLAKLGATAVLVVALVACSPGGLAALVGGARAQAAPTDATAALGPTGTTVQEALAALRAPHGSPADGAWSAANAPKLTLTGGAIEVDGAGVRVEGTTATITRSGTYVLQGRLEDGRIVVDTSDAGLHVGSTTSDGTAVANVTLTGVVTTVGSVARGRAR